MIFLRHRNQTSIWIIKQCGTFSKAFRKSKEMISYEWLRNSICDIYASEASRFVTIERPALNPCCDLCKLPNWFKRDFNWALTTFSTIFPVLEHKLIGRYELEWFLSPRPLYNGTKIVCFQQLGKIPSWKVCWNITVKGNTINLAMCFSNLKPISSGLLLLLEQSLSASITAVALQFSLSSEDVMAALTGWHAGAVKFEKVHAETN